MTAESAAPGLWRCYVTAFGITGHGAFRFGEFGQVAVGQVKAIASAQMPSVNRGSELEALNAQTGRLTLSSVWRVVVVQGSARQGFF
jgi:hypothetical protein